MAGFGGSVKLTGEDEYKNALKQITQGLREVSSQLVLTATKYDSNDKSISNLTKKQNELSQTYQTQKKYVESLRSSYESFASKVQTQAKAHQELSNEYSKEKAELDRLEKTVGTTSQEYQDQKAKVDDLKNALAKSRQEQQQNENALSRMGTALNKAETDLIKTSKEVDGLTKEIEEAQKPTEELGDELEDAGKKAENSANGGFTVFKGILANLGTQVINSAINGLKNLGSACISVGKQALDSYADYEQLVGGVETLFKESAGTVEGYANNAYKTAGLSANQYMETVTSFSAGLISSLGGDTKKAAEYGNRAIVDMSDNANKMGTSMEMIQNAYQGFAKQNYTMLDNLKLGYGGTKTEMQRLIKDASKMTDVQKELGITVDGSSMSFGNIVNAISVMQKSMGIAGTTSKEASQTISGSVNSMKSAWQNLLTGIADDNANFEQLINNFVESIVTVGNNILPRIKTIVQGMGQMVSQLLTQLVPQLVNEIPPLIQETLPILLEAVNSAIQSILAVLPQVVQSLSILIPSIVQMLLGMIPQLIDVGVQVIITLIQGINDALPQLIGMLPEVIKRTVDTLIENLPALLEVALELILTLIKGLSEYLPQMLDYAPTMIEKLVQTLMDHLPELINVAMQIIMTLIQAMAQNLPKLITFVPRIIFTIVSTLLKNVGQIFSTGGQILSNLINGIGSLMGNLGSTAAEIGTTIINKIKNLPKDMLNWGKDMIQGLINGIKSMMGNVGNAVGDVANKIKNFLHFSRPDTGPLREYEEWMPDFIQGLSDSLEESSPQLVKQVKQLSSDMSQAMNPNLAINGSNFGETSSSSINSKINYNSLLEAFEEALSNMKIELDDEIAGKFVRKTVEDTIYT